MLSRMIAEVNKNRCVACGTCIKPCPKEAITIWKGCYAVVDLEKCVGCGKCVRVCPADCITRKERGAV